MVFKSYKALHDFQHFIFFGMLQASSISNLHDALLKATDNFKVEASPLVKVFTHGLISFKPPYSLSNVWTIDFMLNLFQFPIYQYII